MKEASEAYIAAETADASTPAELYRFWTADENWYFTSGDVAVVFGGHTYAPAGIKRDTIVQNEDPATNTCLITISRLTDPAIRYLASLPMNTMKVMVTRIHRFQTPLEGEVKFAGYVGKPVIKGASVQFNCLSIAKALDQQIPNERIQPWCNADLFDDRCKLTAGDYQIDGTLIDMNATGTILTADALVGEDLVLGHILIDGHWRMITAHVDASITLRYPLPVLAAGTAFSAWPGCDGSIETCLAKYDNVTHHRGYPHMPLDNPATWI